MPLRILWCRIFILKCTSTLNYWLYYTRNLCQRKITNSMFQINHEAFIAKINNRKHLHVELELLQGNWRQHNGWTLICHIFGIYETKTQEEVVKPTNPMFYKRFVDDMISKKKKRSTSLTVSEFRRPPFEYQVYHWNKSSLTQRLFNKIFKLKAKFIEMKENFLSIGHRRLQNVTSGMLSIVI